MLIQSAKIMVTAVTEGVGQKSGKPFKNLSLMEAGQKNSWSLALPQTIAIPDNLELLVPYNMVCEVSISSNQYGIMINAVRPPIFKEPGKNGG